MKIVLYLVVGTSSVSFTHAEKSQDSILQVMTYNACRGGTYQGQPLSQSANMIEPATCADILALDHEDNIPKLAELLGWNHGSSFLYPLCALVDQADRGIGKRPWYGIRAPKMPSTSMPMPSTLTSPVIPTHLLRRIGPQRWLPDLSQN